MKISKSIWKTISAFGLILGIVASVLSIWAFLRVGSLSKFIDEAQSWAISIEITKPQNEKHTSGFVVRISGKVKFRTTANESKSNVKTNLALHIKKIEVVQFVRPILKAECVWYLQSKPIVYQDGSFEGLAFLSDENIDDLGIEHQIITIAVPKGIINDHLKYKELPFYIAASNIVSITKRKNE